MNILFVVSEVAPFVKTGGLADVAKALPAALVRLGHEVLVVTPRYAATRMEGVRPLSQGIQVRFPFGSPGAQLWEHQVPGGPRVVFLDQPGFYQRAGLYADVWGDYSDNARRFAFLSLGALEAARALNFSPDVVHLNDWQTGLASLAVKRGYGGPAIARAKVVFTIHNLAYQGLFQKSAMGDLGLPWEAFTPEGLEFHDAVNFLKAGLAFADAIVAVSPRYAREIQGPELGCQLDGFLRARQARLSGILNGVDYSEWDSKTDAFLPAHYSAEDFSGKAKCKSVLRQRAGLHHSSDRPLFGMVARLTKQKGIDLLLGALPHILSQGAEAVLVGSGESRYEHGLSALRSYFPDRVGLYLGFDNALAHLVEAGSDFFLMPSLYEPCGLNQMYSLRYGTPPVVHATGGLDDTVIDAAEASGTGFKFAHYEEGAFVWAMERALAVHRDPQRLAELRRKSMAARFSWEDSAKKYVDLYRSL